MSSRKFVKTCAIAAGFLALSTLSGCVMGGPGPGMRFATRANSVDGNWGDDGGVSTSQLSNGTLTTFDNSNGATLARGTYSYVDADNITLDYLSIGKGQQVKANCRLSTPGRMYCTRADGVQFTLFRKA